MNIDRLRAETPGCDERIHLNNAGAALMPASVLDAVRQHLDLERRLGGYEAEDAARDRLRDAYRSVGQLVGAPADRIAFTQSATTAYAQALSSVPFEAGDVIVTTRNDYVSNQLQFLSLARRFGVHIVRTPDAPEGGVDVDALARAIRERPPKLVCVTHVPTNSGLVQNVAEIGKLCREQEILYLVDACQSVGQMPLDVGRLGCDFLAATSRKFLRGPRGAGFLYVSDRVLEQGLAPLLVDMRGAEWVSEDSFRFAADARRFETFECSIAVVLGMGEAARYANAVGLDATYERVRDLAARIRAALAEIDGVRVLDRGPELCAIVSIAVDGRDPRELMLALRERGINTNAQSRQSAVLDYDAKGVSGSLRLSPHYYNTQDEIDAAIAALRALLGR